MADSPPPHWTPLPRPLPRAEGAVGGDQLDRDDVVLVGEPGAGKTTVAEAVAQIAVDSGIRAAWGRCLDAASTPAYWPWSQVLRSLAPGPAVAAACRRLDGEVGTDEADSVRQFRTYQALAAALDEAAMVCPLLAVVDDLHAADDASLGLLQLLAGDLHRMPVLLLFTVRDTEPSRPLRLALGELLRYPGAERVTVNSFSPVDVATLLERLTGEPPQADVVAALVDRTGGNPFYTTELIRLVSSEHRGRRLNAADVLALDVPSGIRDVLLRRVHRLPDDTQSLLTVAGVAGRNLVPELLEHVTGLDAEDLLLNLEPAVAAGLLTANTAGWGFRFRHPLIQESLRASVGPMERARLHARTERRAIVDEMLDSSQVELTPLVRAVLEASRLTEHIRFGELARFDAEFPSAWRLASDLHSPELQAQLRFVQASRYLTSGDVELGAGIATRGFETMTSVTVTWLQPARFVLDSCLLLLSGTLGEHAERLAASLIRPDHQSLPHLVAPAAALGFAQAGDARQAGEITSRWFAPPPRSWSWIQAIAYWAQVAIAIGAPDPCWLYGLLKPHAGELAVVGAGVDCGGAVDSLLAGLAWRLGRTDEARERARAGLALETRVGSQIWINRTTDLLRQIG